MTREQYFAGQPQLAPRAAGESAEAFGLRAFTFALVHGAWRIDGLEALELGYHVYPLTIRDAGPRGMTSATLDALADCQRELGAAIRRRKAAEALAATQAAEPAQDASQAGQDAPGTAQGGGKGSSPSGGSKVPRRAPKGPRGPAPAAAVPVAPRPAAFVPSFAGDLF